MFYPVIVGFASKRTSVFFQESNPERLNRRMRKAARFMENGTMMANAETTMFTADIPLPLADKVDQLAAKLERSRAWVVKQALHEWIAQEEERSRLTREAMADVDAGRVIGHQAIQAWADSLGTANPQVW